MKMALRGENSCLNMRIPRSKGCANCMTAYQIKFFALIVKRY